MTARRDVEEAMFGPASVEGTLRSQLAQARELAGFLIDEVAKRDATIARAAALAEEWRYKGEFGWDDGGHAWLDWASQALFRALKGES